MNLEARHREWARAPRAVHRFRAFAAVSEKLSYRIQPSLPTLRRLQSVGLFPDEPCRING